MRLVIAIVLLVPCFAEPPAPSRELAALQQLTRQQPRNARAWIALAQAYSANKQTALAKRAATRAEALTTSDAATLEALTYFYVALERDPDKAATSARRYAEAQPKQIDAWRGAAQLALEARQFAPALDAAQHGLAVKEDVALHSLAARAALAMNNFAAAQTHLEAAARLSPYDEEPAFQLAQFHMARQNFAAAEAVLTATRKTFPKSPQIELALGVCAYGQRRFDVAVDHFLKTIALAPDVPQPYLFLGRIFDHATARMDEVTRAFAAYNNAHPQDAAGYVLHAKALLAQLPGSAFPNEAEKPFALLERALALQPANADAHYELGCLLERKRDYARAATELETSLKLDARLTNAHFHLARVYDRLGRKQDAARERELHQKMTEADEARPAVEQ